MKDYGALGFGVFALIIVGTLGLLANEFVLDWGVLRHWSLPRRTLLALWV